MVAKSCTETKQWDQPPFQLVQDFFHPQFILLKNHGIASTFTIFFLFNMRYVKKYPLMRTMVLYLPTSLGDFVQANVGKYSQQYQAARAAYGVQWQAIVRSPRIQHQISL